MTYRVIIKPAGKGHFEYRVDGTLVQGRSSQPLLDACRQLKSMGADPAAFVALYHGDSPVWTVRTTVGKGAELTVSDPPSGGGPKFTKYKAHPRNV
jgi:hypothetical protein